jgi:hypothetical protein
VLRIQNSEEPFEKLRDGQIQLQTLCPNLDFKKTWKSLRKIKHFRPSIRSFLYKLFNASLFIPDVCPACNNKLQTLPTTHFLTCAKTAEAQSSLCSNSNCCTNSFLENPHDTASNYPKFIILLYAVYCVTMNIYYNEEVSSLDFVARVKLKMLEEIKRRDFSFH